MPELRASTPERRLMQFKLPHAIDYDCIQYSFLVFHLVLRGNKSMINAMSNDDGLCLLKTKQHNIYTGTREWKALAKLG